jgi:hypothetical protein
MAGAFIFVAELLDCLSPALEFEDVAFGAGGVGERQDSGVGHVMGDDFAFI